VSVFFCGISPGAAELPKHPVGAKA
jgi:hypothetical protein